MRVISGASVLLWLQHTVWVLKASHTNTINTLSEQVSVNHYVKSELALAAHTAPALKEFRIFFSSPVACCSSVGMPEGYTDARFMKCTETSFTKDISMKLEKKKIFFFV